MIRANLLQTLRARGFVNNVTNETQLENKLKSPITCYIGFDPTADCLHVGNLLQLMCLKHFQNAGHNTIALVGGATAMIGDPSGRSTERPLLTFDQIQSNTEGIARSLSTVLHLDVSRSLATHTISSRQVLENDVKPTLLLNNYSWFQSMSVLDFLRDVGKHFRIHQMLNKHSVKSRMSANDNAAEGISYTEFSYQLLQAHDFHHLYKQENCILQIGGSDQWGNITAGTQLIHRLQSKTLSDTQTDPDEHLAFGLTLPLITTADGKKLGKSTAAADAAIWLNEMKSKPYDFYQYFINLSDSDAVSFLPLFTFLPMEEISDLTKKHNEAPHLRIAQKVLAENVTRIVHGDEHTEKVKKITASLFSSSEDCVLPAESARITLSKEELFKLRIADVVAESDFVTSKKEARRLIAENGLYLNNVVVSDPNYTLSETDIRIDEEHGPFIVLRKGKKKFFAVLISN